MRFRGWYRYKLRKKEWRMFQERFTSIEVTVHATYNIQTHLGDIIQCEYDYGTARKRVTKIEPCGDGMVKVTAEPC